MLENNPISSELRNQIIVVERLMEYARKSCGDDPKILKQAVEDEILRSVIYKQEDLKTDGVRPLRVEHAEDVGSVVVVVAHLSDGREEKVPFLAFFELYKPIALI